MSNGYLPSGGPVHVEIGGNLTEPCELHIGSHQPGLNASVCQCRKPASGAIGILVSKIAVYRNALNWPDGRGANRTGLTGAVLFVMCPPCGFSSPYAGRETYRFSCEPGRRTHCDRNRRRRILTPPHVVIINDDATSSGDAASIVLTSVRLLRAPRGWALRTSKLGYSCRSNLLAC
jgi:hypothetical protein